MAGKHKTSGKSSKRRKAQRVTPVNKPESKKNKSMYKMVYVEKKKIKKKRRKEDRANEKTYGSVSRRYQRTLDIFRTVIRRVFLLYMLFCTFRS